MKNQVCVYIFHQSVGSDVLILPTGLAGRVFRKTSGELGLKRESVTLLGKTDGGPSTSISAAGRKSGFPQPTDQVRAKDPAGAFPQLRGSFEDRRLLWKGQSPNKVWVTTFVWLADLWTHGHPFLRENDSKVIAKKKAILRQCRLAEMESGNRERS